MFVKAGSGPEIVRKGTRAGHTYELLGSLRGPLQAGRAAARASLDESTEVFPLFQHTGIEILYMLERGDGVRLRPPSATSMERGDTLQFEGDIPHGPTHIGQATHPISVDHDLHRGPRLSRPCAPRRTPVGMDR